MLSMHSHNGDVKSIFTRSFTCYFVYYLHFLCNQYPQCRMFINNSLQQSVIIRIELTKTVTNLVRDLTELPHPVTFLFFIYHECIYIFLKIDTYNTYNS